MQKLRIIFKNFTKEYYTRWYSYKLKQRGVAAVQEMCMCTQWQQMGATFLEAFIPTYQVQYLSNTINKKRTPFAEHSLAMYHQRYSLLTHDTQMGNTGLQLQSSQ